MYKVFVNERPVIIVGKPADAKGFLNLEVSLVDSLHALKSVYQRFAAQPGHPGMVLYNNGNVAALFDDFQSLFKNMDAAGGMVRNERREWLFIYRFGYWDLPKGKIEKNETPAEAALREVSEETGINGQSILNSLPNSYHIYTYKNKEILKCTYWYSMTYSGNETPTPQLEESIEQAVWLDEAGVKEKLPEMYVSLRQMVTENLNIR